MCRCGFTSAILGIIGLILALTTSLIFDLILQNYVLLGPNSMSVDLWSNTPKITTSVYIFDVTNEDEVMKGKKPKLVERGPYVYDEYHHKVNTKWNLDNGTVTYQNVREYHFNAKASNGTPEDNLTIVNAPAATISYLSYYLLSLLVRVGCLLLLVIYHETAFVTKPVHEIIFDGYKDPLLTALRKLKDILGDLIPFPDEMDKFAIFYKRNMSASYDGAVSYTHLTLPTNREV